MKPGPVIGFIMLYLFYKNKKPYVTLNKVFEWGLLGDCYKFKENLIQTINHYITVFDFVK
jgi:hypothetical protein